MSDRDIVAKALVGYTADAVDASGTKVATPAATMNQLVKRRSRTVLVSDAATAGTAITETNIFEADVGVTIISVNVATPIAVTASDTTFATFTAAKRTAGGASTTVATQTTKITGGSGNLTAFKPTPLVNSATPANLVLAAGDSLTFAVAKASTGVALNAATSYVEVSVVYEEN